MAPRPRITKNMMDNANAPPPKPPTELDNFPPIAKTIAKMTIIITRPMYIPNMIRASKNVLPANGQNRRNDLRNILADSRCFFAEEARFNQM